MWPGGETLRRRKRHPQVSLGGPVADDAADASGVQAGSYNAMAAAVDKLVQDVVSSVSPLKAWHGVIHVASET